MQSGDYVVYRVNKQSTSPGTRARNIRPNPKGDTYSYQVDKFWVVVADRGDGTLEVATRRDKRHIIDASDGQLRRARWWERWFLAHRFPRVESTREGSAAA